MSWTRRCCSLDGDDLRGTASEVVGRRWTRGIAWRFGVVAESIPRRTTSSNDRRRMVSCPIYIVT